MAAVNWKEPWWFPRLLMSSAILVTLLLSFPSNSESQWITYRSSRNSNLWHPNMPAVRTLRHSSYSSSRDSRDSQSRSGQRPIEHRSGNSYHGSSSSHRESSSNNGAYHGQQQARYASADFGRHANSGKNVRISEIPARSSQSSPTTTTMQHQQRSYHHQHQVPSNSMSHRHLPMSSQKNSKVNWQAQQKSGRPSGVQESTKRPVSQHAGHLLDSWPNTNTHHHLAPVPNGGNSQPGKNGFSNLKPEWGNNVLVSNKPIELGSKSKTAKPSPTPDSKKATDRQLVLPSGYPLKDKTAVDKTINTLTKLSPKKPIVVFMRKGGIEAIKLGADAGDVIKKLAGTSKLPFYNGTNALPSQSIPTVFLAPEDMTAPSGYGKIPIPNLKPKTNNVTPKPGYTKILMPGGTHMKGPPLTTSTTTTPSPTGATSGLEGIAELLKNNSINTLTLDQKLTLLQLLRNEPNHPLADQVSLAILASTSNVHQEAASVQTPIQSQLTPAPPNIGQWPSQPFPGQLPQASSVNGVSAQFQGLPGSIVSSTTLSPVPANGQPQQGDGQDIHKLIGTIVESAVSNTVSTMLQHQRLLQQPNQQQPSLIGVGPPLHANNLPGSPSRPPPPPHFGRGPPPHHRPPPPPPPQGYPRPPFGFQQRPPFPPSPAPGRFPPQFHQQQQQPPQPTMGASPMPSPKPQFPPQPSMAPQFPQPSPSGIPQFQQHPSPLTPQFQQNQPGQQYQPHQQPLAQQSQIVPTASVQHPNVPQFQQPSAASNIAPVVSSTPPPQFFNPSSTLAPNQYPQQQQFQQQQQFRPAQPSQTPLPHPNAIQNQFGKQPQVRLVERPFPNGGKPRNPLHNALQFFGVSTPGPKNQSPTPSPLPGIAGSTQRPPFQPSPTPFAQQGNQHFPSSTGAPPQYRPQPSPFSPQQQQPSPFPPQHQQQPSPFPPQHQQQPSPFPPHHQQQHSQFPPHHQQQPSPFPSQHQQQPSPFPPQLQSQFVQQNQQQPGKKPTVIVQTPNGQPGQKNTYVITGGGNELPEFNKIMKVLNELHVDSENAPPPQQQQHPTSPRPPLQQFSPSTPMPTTPRPAAYSPTASTLSPISSTPFSPTRRPAQFGQGSFINPNVMIKNANQGITPSPSPGGVSSPSSTTIGTTAQPFFASSTGSPIVSSTSDSLSPVSPIMQIIKSIQAQIPGVHVSPSVQTFAEKQQRFEESQQALPSSPQPVIVSSPRPMVSVTPSPIVLSSPRPPTVSASPGPIRFSSPQPQHHGSPTPSPGNVVISSTGFPRVINVNPSESDTPQSIHQAVVEAIMKQQAAENRGNNQAGSQIVVTSGSNGGLPMSGPTSQFIEVIPAGGAIPGLGGDPNAKPFLVKLDQSSNQQQDPSIHELALPGLDMSNPNLRIQKGSLESHETYTHNSQQQSGSVESQERRPVFNREQQHNNMKTHHHSKEVSGEYPEKDTRRPSHSSKEQYNAAEEALSPNRRLYSGESSKSEEQRQAQQKLIEKVITEEKIVWKQGPEQGQLIPAKVRTEERIIMRPGGGKEVLDSEFSQRRTPLSSLEAVNNQKSSSSVETSSKQATSASVQSKEVASSNFAGILRSKMKFDKMMENLYPTKQLVSPFTISNNSANFHHHQQTKESAPTIATSAVTTQQVTNTHFVPSIGPTVPSIIGSTLGGLINASPTPSDQGRFKIKPGDVLSHFPIQNGPPSGSASTEVEQRIVYLPQGTVAPSPSKSSKPKILITTVDELPGLMAQLSNSGANPEVRMVPDKETLERELAKIAATSTVEAQTQTSTAETTTTTTLPPPPSTNALPPSPSGPPSVQSSMFQISPTPTINGNTVRRMDGPEKAFTWHPQHINSTVASPISTTIPFDSGRRMVSGLGAGMLHAMSAGFGNVGNGVVNKYAWLGPSAMPPVQQLPQQPQQQQLLYTMPNGLTVPFQQNPYQQVLIPHQQQLNDPSKQTLQGNMPLGYYSYNFGNLPEQPPTMAVTTSTTSEPSPTKADFTIRYTSQYRDEEVPPMEEKVKPVAPVHKLRKGVKARVRTTLRTTVNPIDPVSAEEYEDDAEDDDDQEELIPNDTRNRGNMRQRQGDDDSSQEDRKLSKKQGHRRRRPGKLTKDSDEDEDEDDVEEDLRRKRPKAKPRKPSFDEEDDEMSPPKQIKFKNYGKQAGQQNNRRIDSDEEDPDEDEYEVVYDVKPVFNVKKVKKTTSPPPTSQPTTTTTVATSTSTHPSRNQAIYVNREMFMVSGEEKGKDNNPKAEPVYQPSNPSPVSSTIGKFPILQVPSIISGQSVVIKSGPSQTSAESKVQTTATTTTTTTQQPKTTAATTTRAATSTKAAPTSSSKTSSPGKGKQKDKDDFSETQDELRSLLKKIQDRLSAQDEVYDFGEDQALYDYYDEINQQVLTTKATLTTSSTTKATQKPGKKKKNKKKGKKGKKSGKKNKSSKKKKGSKKNKKTATTPKPKPAKKIVAVTQSIPTRKPVPQEHQPTSTPTLETSTAQVHLHHQRHPVSSLEQLSQEQQRPTTTTSTTTTTTEPSTTTTTTSTTEKPVEPSLPLAHSMEDAANSGQVSSSVEQATQGVSYNGNLRRIKKKPLWVRRRMGGVNSGGVVGASAEGLQNVRVPSGSQNGKVIRLVRRRRPVGPVGRRRMMQQRRQQMQQDQQSYEQQESVEPTSSTTQPTTSTSTVNSIEVAPPNYSSPPLEKYFEQNSLERRVGNSESNEKLNGTVTLRSPKRKLKLIRLKGQRAQWRLRLQGNGEEDASMEGGPRPSALIAPREVSAPLPLQAPLPSPVYTNQGLHSASSLRAAKSASTMIKHYSTSSQSSESGSVEARVCVRGNCNIVTKQ